MRRSVIVLAALALLLGWLVPAAVADPAARPFRATLEGEIAFAEVGSEVCPEFGLMTQWEAAGRAAHLGLAQASGAHCSSFGAYTGEATLVASNGDEVHIHYAGMGAAFEIGDVIELPCDFEIVGGSGRFEGAEGGGTLMVRTVASSWEGPWETTFTFTGDIGY